MKKIFFLAVSLGLIVLAAIAYQNQTQLLLGFIKYRSANEYEVGPPHA